MNRMDRMGVGEGSMPPLPGTILSIPFILSRIRPLAALDRMHRMDRIGSRMGTGSLPAYIRCIPFILSRTRLLCALCALCGTAHRS
jgi:hypothetical protein